MIWHSSLEKRWQTFSEHRQILMICNELNRAENLRKDPKEYTNGLERALELMDFSIDDIRIRPRLKEFLRARHLIAAMYIGEPCPSSLASIQRGLIQLSAGAWACMGCK
jgi:hypothetical protein